KFFNNDFVNVSIFDPGLSFSLSDDLETMFAIGFERPRIVSAYVGEELFIALALSRFERCFEQQAGNTLPVTAEINVVPDHADMIECASISCKRFQALKADNSLVGSANRHMKNAPGGKSTDIFTLFFDAEWCVEDRIQSRFDDRV